MKSPALAFISVGPYNRLYSEDHFLHALAPLGVSRRSFRALLRALGVPTLHVGSVRLVDHLSFALALRAVLRVGGDDFLVPGCEAVRKGRRVPASAHTLPAAEFSKHAKRCVAELLAARQLAGYHTPDELAGAARDAVERMVRAGLHCLPPREQDDFTRRALADLDADPLLNPRGFDEAPEDPPLQPDGRGGGGGPGGEGHHGVLPDGGVRAGGVEDQLHARGDGGASCHART